MRALRSIIAKRIDEVESQILVFQLRIEGNLIGIVMEEFGLWGSGGYRRWCAASR